MSGDIQSYASLFSIVLISALFLRIIFFQTRPTSTKRLPPGPTAIPIIGHLHLLSPLPHQSFHKLATRYGPLIHLRLGSVSAVVASNSHTAEEILKTHEPSFASRPVSSAIRHLTYGSADFIFAPYGPYWRFMKKLCMSDLLGGRTLEQMQPVRREELRRLLRLLLSRSEKREAAHVGKELITMANRTISRMAISRTCSESEVEAEEVQKVAHEVALLTGTFNLSDYIGFCRNLDLQGLRKRFVEAHRRLDEMMERILKEHEEEKKKKKRRKGDEGAKDILDILMEISEDENAEVKLTRENIKAFVLEMFVAGTDTSALATEWAFAELINHPDVFKKARTEIDSVVGVSRLVEESDIPNLPYLQAIVKETLRLHPTGPLILREAIEDCKIGGYDIPAKTQVFVNVWALGRDPEHWANPLEFNPQRFMPSDSDGNTNGGRRVDVRGHHFHLLPFGSGRRGCPGASLALLLVQSALAAMIQCFDWKVGDGDEENGSVDMAEGPGLTLPRAQPLVCVPIARLNPLLI